MKKIISLGIASAVLALSAVSAFAESASDTTATVPSVTITLSAADAAVGDSVTATVAAGNSFEGLAGNFTFDGLELAAGTTDDAVAGTASTGTTIYNTADNRLSAAKYPAYQAGDVLAVIPLTVTSENATASVQFVGDAEYGEGISATASLNVAAGDASTPDESSEPEESSEPVDSTPEESSTPDESSDNAGNAGTDTNNPGTGVALAVVPAIIAGAAIVVAKKRK